MAEPPSIASLTTASAVEPILRKCLPRSLPLLRRIQFGPHTASTKIVSAGSLPSVSAIEAADSIWTIAMIDRARQPGTEVWLFSSIENLPSKTCTPTTAGIVQQQLLAILATVPVDDTHGSTVLCGSVQLSVAELIEQCGLTSRVSTIYGKYVFPCPADDKTDLPEGIVFSPVVPEDYPDVMANNAIVRSASMISSLPSAAARLGSAEGKAVAWAFLDIDGSVRTVFVQPEWRRKGLAGAVVRHLLHSHRERLRNFDDDGTGWACADVSAGNEPSAKLFEALGARNMWDVVWLWVDLNRIKPLQQRVDSFETAR